jgi:hypothetical protein
MVRCKCLTFFLLDCDVNGRIKCTDGNWKGLAFKIPRTTLKISKDIKELNYSGVYFLFGKDDQTDQNVVYIGQAGARENGRAVLNRLEEHNVGKDFWNEAIVITTVDHSLGATELSYLESRFYEIAKEANRYDVKNEQKPTKGNTTDAIQSVLEDFIDYSKIVVGTLGHKVFEPLDDGIGISNERIELLCTRNGASARAVRTSDGFVVKKGSLISQNLTPSCPQYSIELREKYRSIIIDNKITEDILFNTPSGAACFVSGSSANGYKEWKTEDGRTLKQIDAEIGSIST